ncbi:hypothetical protein [Methylosinus sp. RM1]|uniref:hypothetical protein n=1 Tax=Methylosinus sp. RM1 TaxID=2583817 RepID=UPI00351A0CDD
MSDLTRAVQVMGKAQLGVELSDEDAAAITAFLGALTQRVPANYSAPTPFPDTPRE